MAILRKDAQDLLSPAYDASLRVRQTDRVMSAFDEVCGLGASRLIHLSGGDGMGKTSFLADVVRRVSADPIRPTVIAGGFDKANAAGSFSGWHLPTGGLEMGTVLTALGQTVATGAAAASVLDPSGLAKTATAISALAGQAAQAASFVAERGGSAINRPVGPAELDRAIRRAATHSFRLVVAIDDLHLAEPQLHWSGLFARHLLPSLLLDLPVLFIVSTATDGGQEAGTTFAELANQDASVGVHLGALTARDLGHLEPRLAEDVAAVSGGNPGWVATLVSDWREQGLIGQDPRDGIWRWLRRPGELESQESAQLLKSSVRTLVLDGIWGATPHGSIEFQTAKDILSFAALEGPTFTAEAVAAAVGKDPDVVIDWFDDALLVSNNRPGLLQDEGFRHVSAVRGLEARDLCRYRFTSRLLWLAFRPTKRGSCIPESLRARVDLYIEALLRAHNGQVWPIATTLSRLRLLLDDAEGASFYERSLDGTADVDENVQLIRMDLSSRRRAVAAGEAWTDARKTSTAHHLLRAGLAIKYKADTVAMDAFQGALDIIAECSSAAKDVSHQAFRIEKDLLREAALLAALHGALGDALAWEEEFSRRCQAIGDHEGNALSVLRRFEVVGLMLSVAEDDDDHRWRRHVTLRHDHPREMDESLASLLVADLQSLNLEVLRGIYQSLADAGADVVRNAGTQNRTIKGSSYHRVLGRRATHLHQHGEASRQFRAALAFAAEDVEERMEALAHLGASLVAEGEFDEGRRTLGAAIRDCLRIGVIKRLPSLLFELGYCEWRSEGPRSSLSPLGHALVVCGWIRHQQQARGIWKTTARVLVETGSRSSQVARCVGMVVALDDPEGEGSGNFEALLEEVGAARAPAGSYVDDARTSWARDGGVALVESVLGIRPGDTDVYLATQVPMLPEAGQQWMPAVGELE